MSTSIPPIARLSTRRRFLVASSGMIAAGLATRGLGQEGADKLRIGIIGAGGRGAANTSGVAGEVIAALCDTNPAALAEAKARHPGAKGFSDWRELLEAGGLDAVVISTADHHHAPAALAALRRGLHVYCEKPLAHSVEEARLMQDEALRRKGQVATQMGTQIHATANYRRVVELVQAGAIGLVSEAHVWCNRGINPIGEAVLAEEPIPEGFDWEAWIGPAEMRPYNGGYWKGGNLNWNRRWDFGGGVLGDMGSHLIDLPFWALGLGRPLSVESEGPEPDPVACPPWQVVTWEHPAREGNASWLSPTKVVWYHGDEGMRRRAELLQPMVGEDTRIADWGIGVAFVGSEGVLVADYGKLVLSPGEKFASYERPPESIPPSPGHYLEWIHAAKTGGESLCSFGYSGALIEHNLLGNVAHRLGKRLEWDGDSLSVPGVPEADGLIRKGYREGWGV